MIMKGMFEMTETFLKILTTAYLAVMLLGIFFAINNYYLYFKESEVNRDVLTLADGMLSAECLVEYENSQPKKAVLSSNDLDAEKVRSASCIVFGKNFKYEIISAKDSTVLYKLGNQNYFKTVNADNVRSSMFPAAMKYDKTGEVIPIMMNVTVEVTV